MANEIARGLRKHMTPQEVNLRFWNRNIDRNPEGMPMRIEDLFKEAPPSGRPPADHPPPKGEG